MQAEEKIQLRPGKVEIWLGKQNNRTAKISMMTFAY